MKSQFKFNSSLLLQLKCTSPPFQTRNAQLTISVFSRPLKTPLKVFRKTLFVITPLWSSLDSISIFQSKKNLNKTQTRELKISPKDRKSFFFCVSWNANLLSSCRRINPKSSKFFAAFLFAPVTTDNNRKLIKKVLKSRFSFVIRNRFD